MLALGCSNVTQIAGADGPGSYQAGVAHTEAPASTTPSRCTGGASERHGYFIIANFGLNYKAIQTMVEFFKRRQSDLVRYQQEPQEYERQEVVDPSRLP